MDVPGKYQPLAHCFGIRNLQVERAGLILGTTEIQLMHEFDGAGHRRADRRLCLTQGNEGDSEEKYPHCRVSLQALSWWRKLVPGGAEPPLIEVPAGGRVKFYLADSGFAYEYRFQGHRQFPNGDREYLFNPPDRSISVLESHALISNWQQLSARILTDPERVAIATMVLRRIFDEATAPSELPSTTSLNEVVLLEIAGTLDL